MRWNFLAATAALFTVYPTIVAAQSAAELEPKVLATVTRYCAQCHQRDDQFPNRKLSKFENVLDLKAMAKSKYVIPGDPEKSMLYTQVATDKMPDMADVGITPAVPADQKKTLFDWIKALPPQ